MNELKKAIAEVIAAWNTNEDGWPPHGDLGLLFLKTRLAILRETYEAVKERM